MNLVSILAAKKLIDPPKFCYENLCLLVKTGSEVYGCKTDSSDLDLAAVCVPTKNILFPYEDCIFGFGSRPRTFETYQKHHIQHENTEVDLTIYSIVKFFELCRQGNPNLIDILFTPERYVVHETTIGRVIRENKNLFISGRIVDKYLAYCSNHIANLREYKAVGKRASLLEKYGFDTKDAGNTIRGALSVYQILDTGTYDPSIYGDHISDIRSGVYSYEEICDEFQDIKENIKSLRLEVVGKSIPEEAPEKPLKDLLVKCLEIQYGNLHIREESKAEEKLRIIMKLLEE